MGKIINFSEVKKQNNDFTDPEGLREQDPNFFYYSLFPSLKDDHCFMGIIEQWPCFTKKIYKGGLKELFRQYCDNLLTKSQECVIDLMLHIHDPHFVFDITFSLKNWDEDNRNFFMYFLEKHAEAVRDIEF